MMRRLQRAIVMAYARLDRIPLPSVYTRNYEGAVTGVLVDGLDGNHNWLSAGEIISEGHGQTIHRENEYPFTSGG
jgi:hypothetical protein